MGGMDPNINQADNEAVDNRVSAEVSDDISDEALERASWVGLLGATDSCARTDTSGSEGCGNACC